MTSNSKPIQKQALIRPLTLVRQNQCLHEKKPSSECSRVKNILFFPLGQIKWGCLPAYLLYSFPSGLRSCRASPAQWRLTLLSTVQPGRRQAAKKQILHRKALTSPGTWFPDSAQQSSRKEDSKQISLVLCHPILSRLMTPLGSLAQRQSGSASIYKETACQSSPVVHLLLHPVSSVSPAGLPQLHGTRRDPRLWVQGGGEDAKGLEVTSPSHIFKWEW